MNTATASTSSLLPREHNAQDANAPNNNNNEDAGERRGKHGLDSAIRRTLDLRLCTIAALLCSLNLLDSSLLSSASVTSLLPDLRLDQGNRFSLSILIFTVASVVFQLPATILVRVLGPRVFFCITTVVFGVITLAMAWITTWRQMIAMRVLLGIAMAGIFPGLAVLVSSWYRREELQLRFAFLQAGQLIVLASGGIGNFGLNKLDGRKGLKGWQWMFLVQGLIAIAIGIAAYWWIVDFPERETRTFLFLTRDQRAHAVKRIEEDRGDVVPSPFTLRRVLRHFTDWKIYGFSAMFFLLNLVSTALSYFLPIILKQGMGFSEDKAILLSQPPYYYAVIPVLLSSRIGDKFGRRGAVITFNSICLVIGFAMLGFARQVIVRYVGTYLATGAYVSNWAALNGYQASNIRGQWKRAVTASAITACNGLGGVAGSFIVRQNEAPRYFTAVWVSIGSHVMIVGTVAVFTVYFFTANRRQRKGKKVLEELDGFRYTY